MREQEAAETLALDVLAWLAADADLSGIFMGSSGLSQDDLRTRAGEPELLAAVLDFVLMDDAWVMAYCDGRGVPYDRLMQARAALPGGEQVHWT